MYKTFWLKQITKFKFKLFILIYSILFLKGLGCNIAMTNHRKHSLPFFPDVMDTLSSVTNFFIKWLVLDNSQINFVDPVQSPNGPFLDDFSHGLVDFIYSLVKLNIKVIRFQGNTSLAVKGGNLVIWSPSVVLKS